MRSIDTARSFNAALLAASFLIASPSLAQAPGPDWAAVDRALGRPGTTQPDGIRRYGFPRSDLHVVLDGVTIRPALALGGWIAFEPMGTNAAVMGDLVLTPDEVNPVMSKLLKGGMQVTAVHNHLLRSSPETIYMHVQGRGDAARLAATLRAALALSHTPLAVPAAAASPPPIGLDTAAIERIMGKAGKANGGVYQFTFPRSETIIDDGMAEPASMGTGTAINFQATGRGRAAVTGDFVVLGGEVDPVMRELRGHGIDVTALHSHMIGEQPTIYFMHFWGVGQAAQLAAGLRAALDRTNVER